jgi:hypothetical protein
VYRSRRRRWRVAIAATRIPSSLQAATTTPTITIAFKLSLISNVSDDMSILFDD